MREELDDLGTTDGSRKQPKVKVPPSHPGDRRQHLPVKVILQHRRLSPRRPGPTAMGPFAQSAFVDEDDGTALFLGFFLISGQRSCFHRRILSSSRSSARPTGRRCPEETRNTSFKVVENCTFHSSKKCRQSVSSTRREGRRKPKGISCRCVSS